MDELRKANRPRLAPDQLHDYFERIKLPSRYRSRSGVHSLEVLAALQRYHCASIPFENLDLHYSSHHSISLDPPCLIRKIVERGHGGYCMEQTSLFGMVLQTLGFEFYHAGARVSESLGGESKDKQWGGRKFGGWDHMLIIATVDNQRYIVDVGNGPSGPMLPLPLTEGEVHTSVAPQEARLIHSEIPQCYSRTPLWLYQHRYSPEIDWIDTYCFTETEFISTDFEMMNFYTSQHRTSWFTRQIVCAQMLIENDSISSQNTSSTPSVPDLNRVPKIVGHISLFEREVKKRVGGKSEVLETCETEEDRIAALDKYFGIKLLPEEKAGIRGMISELA